MSRAASFLPVLALFVFPMSRVLFHLINGSLLGKGFLINLDMHSPPLEIK